MFERDQHKIILIKILKAIYSDPILRTILGFKGETAGFLFYNLPRLSVDLDFEELNLIDLNKKKFLSYAAKFPKRIKKGLRKIKKRWGEVSITIK